MKTRDDVIARLYEQHYGPLLRTAFLLVGRDGAEDLVQDAFVRALDKWRPDAPEEAFRAWAHTTMTRRSISAWRRRRREQVAYASHGAETRADDPAVVPEVEAALASLSPRQRAAIVLAYFEDASEATIAERMGVRPGTVKALLHQARERLRLDATLSPMGNGSRS